MFYSPRATRLFPHTASSGYTQLGLDRLYSRVLSETIAMTDAIAVSWKRLLQFIMSGKP